MLSRRKPLAALAAVTTALAAGIPVASASADTPAPTVDPTVCQLVNLPAGLGPFGLAQMPGGASLLGVLANAGGMVGCAAAPASPFEPALPAPAPLPAAP